MIFAGTSGATGQFCAALESIQVDSSIQILDPESSDGDSDNGVSRGRKRSATTTDPKKAAGSKSRSRITDHELRAHVGDLVKALQQPVKIVRSNSDEEWVKEAHDIWERDFDESASFEVTNAIFNQWAEKPRTAYAFVRGSERFRKKLVASLEQEHGNSERVDDCEGEDW